MFRFFIILFLFVHLHADEDYRLGEGLQLGSLPIYVGGYFSLDYKQTEYIKRYRVDDIAVLSYGNYNKFSYMLEAEYKEFYSVIDEKDEKKYTQKNTQVLTERAYVDYNYDENYMLRIGKYNSPIGFWNLLPINVLRETTSSPVSTYILFPKFTTGIAAAYNSYEESETKIDIILQHNKGIDDGYNNYEINRHYGIGLTYAKNDYSFKINGGYFNQHNNLTDIENYYLLLSGKYETDHYKIMSEFGTQYADKDFTTSYAGYIQGSYNFYEKHTTILRLESYKDLMNDKQDDIAILGYTYRPFYPIALKSEFQIHSIQQENQFLCSVSVLF